MTASQMEFIAKLNMFFVLYLSFAVKSISKFGSIFSFLV